MKKMTLKDAKANLKKDYITALAFFAEYLNQFEDEEEQYDALEELDERLFDRTFDWELDDEYMRIYTALRTAVG